jgi:hypothetical protein
MATGIVKKLSDTKHTNRNEGKKKYAQISGE